MNYEAAIESTVTAAEARREIARHYASWEEFTQEYGDHAEYSGADVLAWLGY